MQLMELANSQQEQKNHWYLHRHLWGMGGLSNVVGFYSLYGPDDLWKLKEMAEKVEQDLLSSKEISQVDILGYPPVIIAVDIRENDLLKYGLDFTTISNIIKMSNIDLSGGSIKTDNEEIVIRSMNRSTDPEKVKEIVILAYPLEMSSD